MGAGDETRPGIETASAVALHCDRIRQSVESRLDELAQDGSTIDSATALEVLGEAAAQFAEPPDLVGLVSSDDERRALFASTNRSLWGVPLDELRALCIWTEAFGAELATHGARVENPGAELLRGVLAAASATTKAVWWSLTGGFGQAAEGTTRSLVELAVTARLIGWNVENEELLDRYHASIAVADLKDLRARQGSWENFGREPPDPEDVERVDTQLQAFRDRYNNDLRHGFWWAKPVCSNTTMPGALDHVGLSRYQPFVATMNHAVHADHSSLRDRYVDDDDGPVWLSGASAAGIGRPGALAVTLLGLVAAEVGAVALDFKHADSWPYGVAGRAISLYSHHVADSFAEASAKLINGGHGPLSGHSFEQPQ